MSHRSQRDRERALDEALEGSGLARSADDSENAELRDLLALTSELRNVRNSLPEIDERQVWLRVRSGMLEQPQRRAPRGLWERLLPLASFTPRLVLASAAGLLLFIGAAVVSLMQPAGNASAAFIERLDSIEGASALVAEQHEVSPGERARIEREAFELLDLASKPGVLGDVPPAEAEAIRARLANVRGSLASVLNEEVSEARTLAALAAVSGLITTPPPQVHAPESPTAAATPTAPPSAPPTVAGVAPVLPTATPSPAPTRVASPVPTVVVVSPTPRPSASPTPNASAEPTASPQRTAAPTSSPTSTATPARPQATPTVNASPTASATQPPTQRPSQAEAAARSAALARAQSLCGKVVDRSSLDACMGAGAQAQEACPASDPTCLAVLQGIVEMAQERLDRMRDGCRRLNTSKARAACEDAMRIDGRRSNATYEGDAPSSDTPPIPTDTPTRGTGFNSRRDW